MNELEAVNTILRTIGQVPVLAIPDSGMSDARLAYETLTAYTKELQTEGYEFNTDDDVKLTPDNQGVVRVPENAIRVWSYNPSHRYTVRAGTLYDLGNRTGTFTEPIKVSMVTLRPFEELPYTLQRYVVIRSARVFANQTIGAQEQNSYNQEDEVRARLAWLNSLAEDMDLNVLSSTSHTKGNVYRPYNTMRRYQ